MKYPARLNHLQKQKKDQRQNQSQLHYGLTFVLLTDPSKGLKHTSPSFPPIAKGLCDFVVIWVYSPTFSLIIIRTLPEDQVGSPSFLEEVSKRIHMFFEDFSILPEEDTQGLHAIHSRLKEDFIQAILLQLITIHSRQLDVQLKFSVQAPLTDGGFSA